MSMYPGLQPFSARFRFNEAAKYEKLSIAELEKTVFPKDPDLFSRLAFRRGEGIPKKYREAAAQPVDEKMIFLTLCFSIIFNSDTVPLMLFS